MGMLDGKVAIITGAGRGLGREEALAMVREGAKVLINDLGIQDGTKIADVVVDEIKEMGGDAIANYDSVTDFNKTKAMIDHVILKYGKLDILINNAGILKDRMIFNMTEEDWDDIVDINLKGTFNMSRHASAYFRKRGKQDNTFRGRIINTSSDAGLRGGIGQSNYGSAKSGVATLSIITSREIKKYATVNCIVPIARTRLTTEFTPTMMERMNQKTKSGMDLYHPSNVAPLVVFLASDEAIDISGQVFRIFGDMCQILQSWTTIDGIHNNGKKFTPQILVQRVKSELMKSATPPHSITEDIQEMLNR